MLFYASQVKHTRNKTKYRLAGAVMLWCEESLVFAQKTRARGSTYQAHCLSVQFLSLYDIAQKIKQESLVKSIEILKCFSLFYWSVKSFAFRSAESQKVTRILFRGARYFVGGAVYQIFSSPVRFCWPNNMSKSARFGNDFLRLCFLIFEPRGSNRKTAFTTKFIAIFYLTDFSPLLARPKLHKSYGLDLIEISFSINKLSVIKSIINTIK